MTEPLLEIKNLQAYYFGPKGRIVRAVDGVDLTVRENEVVGLVGESGCGKSATGLCIMRLTPPPGRIVGGTIRFGGMDIANAPEEEVRKIRGSEVEGESSIGDYKEVAGMMMPHAVESGAKGSPQKQKLTIDKIEVNVPIDDTRFVMPEVKKEAPATPKQ